MKFILATFAVAVLSLPAAAAPIAPEAAVTSRTLRWRSSLIARGSNPVLALDPGGAPFVALAGDAGIAFARTARWGWSVTTLDPEAEGEPALAIDRFGVPHLAFVDAGQLVYATTGPQSRWRFQVLAERATGPVSVALNLEGEPRIAFVATLADEKPNVRIRLATRHRAGWGIETVPRPLFSSARVGLAIDAADEPFVLFDLDESLQYAARRRGDWTSERVADDLVSSAIATSPDGVVHIAYAAGIPDERRTDHCVWTGEEWECDTVEPAEHGLGLSLAIDSGGAPQLAYVIGDQLRLAARAGGRWVATPILVPAPRRAGRTSFALDGASRPHIAYEARDGVREAAVGEESPWGDRAGWIGGGEDESGAGRRSIAAWPLPYRGGALEVAFAGSSRGPVEVTVHDLAGRRLRTLARGDFGPGEHHARWDGRDDYGRAAGPGIVFLRRTDRASSDHLKIAIVP